MPEQQKKTNPVVVGVLLVLVVALAATIVYLFQNSQAPQVSQGTPQTQAPGMPPNMGAMPAGEPVPFDPATATRVPDGVTPNEYLTDYLIAAEQGDWDAAYAALPLAKQQSYGSADAFGSQLAGYGIVGHDVQELSATDDEIVLAGVMKTSAQGDWRYDWTFKQVDGVWYAAERGPVVMLGQ